MKVGDRHSITSPLHGERVFVCVAITTETFTRATWEASCAICGARFQIKTPATVKSKAFGRISCDRHKLTRSEAARLRAASAAQRAAVFEAIKRAKLGRSE